MDSFADAPFLVVHPSGNTYVRQDLRTLHDARRLACFFTGLGCSRDGPSLRLPWPHRWRAELEKRAYDLPPEIVRAHPLREMARLALPHLGLGWMARHEKGWASMDGVFRALDRAAARFIRQTAGSLPRGLRPRAVLAYEDGAEAVFTEALRAGWATVYHLPIAYGPYARALFQEEAQRLPEWAPTLQGDRDSPAKLARKERELALAQVILCPSRFVLESLPEGARRDKSCHVVPYGAPSLPPENTDARDPRDSPPNRPLRLLFAGALSQRKGLADVFAAMRLLGCPPDIELVLFGRPSAPWAFYYRQGVKFTHEAPRANAAVLELMGTCDALVLPSLVEGRAIVQLEALSRGLPLLVTPNAGGDDLVTPGETGFLVPVRDPAALAEKIAWLRDNRARLPEMRAACRARANTATWETYRRRLHQVLWPAAS